MDASTSPQQKSSSPVQPVSSTQPPIAVVTEGVVKPIGSAIPTPQSFSTHPEQGPIQTGAVSESADGNDEVMQPAKQEVSSRPAQQTVESQQVELQPTVPEISVEKNIEHVVEKSPDSEKPKLTQAVKAAGVTLSGPGIPVDENVFGVKSLPMTYEEAAVVDKQTKMNDSKHWLSELVMYIWRKLDPTIGKKGVKN